MILRKLALAIFGINTLALLILLEMIMFGLPYLNLFALIFLLTYRFNRQFFYLAEPKELVRL